MDLKAFGKRVRTARKRRDMTGEVMAEKCDITPTFLRQIEAGTKGVSIDNFVNICNVLDVSPEYLLSDELNTPRSTMRTRAELLDFINTLDERSFKTVLDIIKHLPLS